ncbi:MAG TPA: hypothetical protein VK772_08320 [Puia sp.]|nr:hypothetical protein [Puia sp.]
MNSNISKRIRELASTFIILILLSIILCFYYFKFVPERRTEFHRNAFLELSQMESALQSRDAAYRDAIQNILKQTPLDKTSLLKFNFQAGSEKTPKGSVMGPTEFGTDKTGKSWQMRYPVYVSPDFLPKTKPAFTLSKNVDTLMGSMVSTYKDIFDEVLLITDSESQRQKGEIIYKSGDLSMDYQVNSDSLLKKTDGFSLLNLHDVTIEGNPFKLFIYPFKLGDQRLILAGLISQSNYTQSFAKIPFNFFSFFAVLILLLVIHLPILKIFLLGKDERIKDGDIRLIIGSYFIAAFFGFFLLSKIFLDKEQNTQNRRHLEILASRIKNNFNQELDTIRSQLREFDEQLNLLTGSSHDENINGLIKIPGSNQINFLDSQFKAGIYPYLTNVFWIDSEGSWVARWAYKKNIINSPLIDIHDRLYYSDFVSHKALLIPGMPDSMTIQPTLSKLEGEYIVTVVIKSKARAGTVLKKSPWLVGLSSEMHSVANTVLPPGYGFSIINEEGDIMFDSKPGRPLLSNLLKETNDPTGIQQTVFYRSKRFFDQIMLRSKTITLLSQPIDGTPYQLLVYYNLFRSDGFEEHLVGLSALLVGTVIVFLICSAFANQISKTKGKSLENRSHHFEWLFPSTRPLKQEYYRHLKSWMLVLLAVFVLVWAFVETIIPRSEFSLIFISLLFPFYIALFYYELRDQYYQAPPATLLRGILLLIILSINCFTAMGDVNKNISWSVLIAQLLWAVVIFISVRRFRKYQQDNPRNDVSSFEMRFLKPYIWAILTGVILITIVPASTIFWLLYRQETSLDFNSDQLTFARQIDERRDDINQRLSDYTFNPLEPGVNSFVYDLKFNHGIYNVAGFVRGDDSGALPENLPIPSPEYTSLHRHFFPEDSLILAWTGPLTNAADGSWYFAKDSSGNPFDPELIYLNSHDAINKNPFRLTADSAGAWNTTHLMSHSFSGTGSLFQILFLLICAFGITTAYFLTHSLVRRIFLVDVKIAMGDKKDPGTDYATIWKDLSGRQKYLLLNFIEDGFSNYKAENDLRILLDKGLLYFEDLHLKICTPAFQKYILQIKDDPDITLFQTTTLKDDGLKKFKVPLLLVLAGIGLFIFFTQDAIYQKITGLLASLSSILPLLTNMFNKSDGNSGS